MTYLEGETAHLTCSTEFNETIEIATIKYEYGSCSHNHVYGIKNMCNENTECVFDVTNSNVGSSCGTNGLATFEVTYNCLREFKISNDFLYLS